MWYKFAQNNLNIELPDYVYQILSDINASGGRALIVGGAVRDAILGYNPKDIDFEVYRVSYEKLNEILSQYGKADLVGKSFGVIKFVGPDGADFDFSLPRTDSKAGVGHRDFNVEISSDLTPEQAAARRDFTMNAISYDPLTHEIIDPYNGREDIKNKILRHTSDAFAEDPLRILRGMQFSSRYGFDIAPETAELAQSIREEYQHLPKERVEQEFKKLVQKGIEPGRALEFLYSTGWSENFPEIHSLKGTPQEFEYHPEGWSIRIVPPNSFTTGVAVAQPIDLLSRELILRSQTNSTSGKPGNITAQTKLTVKSRSLRADLSPTNITGFSNFVFSPAILSPTSLAPAKSLVRIIRTSANGANKVIGVMFQIPVSSMLTIVGSTIDNNEIVQGIIKSVAIYVMNMLTAEQRSTQMKLHDISMEEHAAGLSSGDRDFSISPGIIDPKFSIVNNNVVFYFYLSSVGNIDIHNNGIDDNHIYFLVEIGDVAIHTAHVMNAAAQIADRENLSPEEREVLIYAALAHDFAKPATTKVINKKGIDRITSHGHEEQGGPMARAFLESIGVNKKIIDQVVPLVENHLNHIHFSNSKQQGSFVKQLAERLYPSNIRMLQYLIEADHSGRPPLPKELPAEAQSMREYADKYNIYTSKFPDLLEGKDVIKYTEGKGGPFVGEILKKHRDLILKDSLNTREEALQWLDKEIQSRASYLNGYDAIEAGYKGAEIKDILNRAWEAQKNQVFNSREEALTWLQGQTNNIQENQIQSNENF